MLSLRAFFEFNVIITANVSVIVIGERRLLEMYQFWYKCTKCSNRDSTVVKYLELLWGIIHLVIELTLHVNDIHTPTITLIYIHLYH